MDSAGNVLKTFPANSTPADANGARSYTWNGTRDSGATVADGTYFLKVVAPDGKSYGGTTFREETIDAIGFDASGSPLLISGQKAWAYNQLFTVS